MTSYNGQSITYDEIGNPLTYRDGMTMTWTGRQLTTLTQNGKQNTYKYDVDGLRLEKTAGGVTTQYQYVNGQLLGEKTLERRDFAVYLRCARGVERYSVYERGRNVA